MATPVNFFRSGRHYRRVFREGRLLLASEGMELQLQVLDHLRTQIKETFGENSAVEKALKVEIDPSDNERIIIRPGQFYIDGYPLELQAGTDQKYLLGKTTSNIDSSDFIRVDKTSTDDGGIAINFGGGTPETLGSYSIVVSIQEELITAADDPYLRSANLNEDTAEVHRIIFNINIVETSNLDSSPIPYTGTSDDNLVNEIEITRSGSTYSILDTRAISGSETIDGRNLEVEFDNGNGGSTAAFPTANDDLSEYIHGKLIDTNGVEYHITNMFVTPGNLSTITVQLDLEKTRPVQAGTNQPEPTVNDGLTYKLRKRDLYVTESNNLPSGNRFWRIADLQWDGANFTSIEDKRKPSVTDIISQNATSKLVKGGTWDWDLVSNTLSWNQDAYVQIAGFIQGLNAIETGNVSLTQDGEVAYVELNRNSGASGYLTVQTSLLQDVELTDNTFIFARRVGDDVLIGRSFLLKDKEFLELDGALAEINRYFGSLRIIPHETDTNKVRITAVGVDKLNNTKLTQSLDSYLVKFDGAVLDFDTGDIFEDDGVTPYGDTFTPASLGTAEYFWYGITLTQGDVNADNTMTPSITVTQASSGNTTESSAPFADLDVGLQLGQVKVLEDSGSIADIEYDDIYQLITIGGSGGGTGIVKVNYHDPISTTLPTGSSVTIDGQTGADGDRVLFTNLASGNNQIYELSGVGTSISWKTTSDFNQGIPEDGDLVIATEGDSFKESIGKFDGTEWKFNDVVRYFSGADYWEQSSLKTSDILASTTDNIFTITLAGSENITIDYSIQRGSAKETGIFIITSDGTNVSTARTVANISDVDTELNADISGSDLRFRYTAGAGSDGLIKYSVKRWSNAAGGPGGIPSYSGSGGSSTSAAGNINEIQYHGAGGNLAADSNFKWNPSDDTLELGDLSVESIIGSTTLNDNQTTPSNIINLDSTLVKFAVIEYSIERGGESRVGRILVCHNGTTASLTEDSVDTGGAGIDDTEIVFSALLSGGSLFIRYTSSNTGNTGSFRYSVRKWA